jgi:hypothetical protein
VTPVMVSRGELELLHPRPRCRATACDGRWSGWSKCNTHCGVGSEKRRFAVTHLAACGGAACRYTHGEEQERQCVGPGANCCPGGWGRWTPCSTTCGGGVQARVYEVDFNHAPAGCEAGRCKFNSVMLTHSLKATGFKPLPLLECHILHLTLNPKP